MSCGMAGAGCVVVSASLQLVPVASQASTAKRTTCGVVGPRSARRMYVSMTSTPAPPVPLSIPTGQVGGGGGLTADGGPNVLLGGPAVQVCSVTAVTLAAGGPVEVSTVVVRIRSTPWNGPFGVVTVQPVAALASVSISTSNVDVTARPGTAPRATPRAAKPTIARRWNERVRMPSPYPALRRGWPCASSRLRYESPGPPCYAAPLQAARGERRAFPRLNGVAARRSARHPACGLASWLSGEGRRGASATVAARGSREPR